MASFDLRSMDMTSRNASTKVAGYGAYLLAVFLGLSLMAGTAVAQGTGSISGTVKDTSGATVPDTAVTVKHLDTGLTRTATTDASGSYSLAALPVGQYEVDAQKSGFKQVVRRGVTLAVGQQLVVDLALEVGAVEQQVTVTAEAPLLETTMSSTSGLVGEQQVKDLPLNGRSFDQLLALNTATVNFSPNTSRSSFSVGGRRPDANRFLLNGVEWIGTDNVGLYETPYGASGQALGIDAVREFNVVTDTAGAEFGKRSGGQVNVVSSSGTNQLHGTLFEFLRNSDLDARNFFDRRIGAPPFKRNQFGASLGGPLKKDKLFLFGNYEGFRQRLGLSVSGVVPDDQARLGNLPIGPNNSLIQVPNLDPRMLPFFAAFWPTANGPSLGGGAAQYFANPAQSIREDFGLTRLDYNISETNSLSANVLVDNGELTLPAGFVNFIGDQHLKNSVWSLSETRIFSPTLLNVATLGWSRAYTVAGSLPTVPFPSNLLFVTGTGNIPGSIAIGGSISGGSGVAASISGGGGGANQYIGRNLITGNDDVHYTRGSHSLSFGLSIQRVQVNNYGNSTGGITGSASFSGLTTFLQDSPSAFLTGVTSASLGYRSTEAGWYVKDEIKLRPNLTLSLGVRDEMTTGFYEKSGRASNYTFDQTGTILADPFVGRSALTENHALALWQPRIGLAWSPGATGKWSVRAGFGIYNDLQDHLEFRLGNEPFNSVVTEPAGVPLFSYIPFNATVQPPPPCSFQLEATNQPCSIFSPQGVEPNFKTPTLQQWTLTIERQLGANTLVRAAYAGSEGYHQEVNLDMNIVNPLVCSDPAGCASGGVMGAVGQVAQGVTYLPPSRPSPGKTGLANPYVNYTFSWFFAGTSSYNALDLSLTQRLSHGLAFKADYTFAKGLDDQSSPSGTTGSNAPSSAYDRFNIGLNRGLAAFNLRHQFNANFSYDLPFGPGKKWGNGSSGVWSKVIGGWQWNSIIAAQGGFPVTPQVGSNISGSGNAFVPDSPNRNPAFTGPIVIGNAPSHWYNPQAFLLPTPGTFGNVGRAAFRGPGLTTFDTSLFKRIPISERLNLQFRAEAFNVLNHTNFGNPNPTIFSGGSGNYNPAAGLITSTATTARQLQFALRLTF